MDSLKPTIEDEIGATGFSASGNAKRMTAGAKVIIGITALLLLSATVVAALLFPVILHDTERQPERPPSTVHFTFSEEDPQETTVVMNRSEFEDAVRGANESTINFTFVDHTHNISVDLTARPENTTFLKCTAAAMCEYGLRLNPPMMFSVGGEDHAIAMLHCNDDSCSTSPTKRRGAAGAAFRFVQVAWWFVEEPAGGCFPSTAQVMTAIGPKPISEVRIGDTLLDGDGTFSPVYLLGHSDPAAFSSFVVVKTDSGHTLSLTPLHYVEADGAYMHAKDVEPGMAMKVRDERTGGFKSAAVESTQKQLLAGLYNPYTASGTVVVDGVVASAHSEWFLEGWVHDRFAPRLCQALLAPVRGIFRLHPQWVVRFTAHFHNSHLPLDQHGACEITRAMAATLL